MTAEAPEITYLPAARRRRVLCERALAAVDVEMSPEFAAALLPAPREKMVIGGWQAGKALGLHTEIQTPTGPRRLQDIAPGDYVLDEHGEPTVVRGVSATWEDRRCYRVRFSDGTSAVADEAHEWDILRQRRYRDMNQRERYVETRTARTRYTTGALRGLKMPLRLPGSQLQIVEIEDTASEPVRCIEVDSPEHTFRGGNGWVTHNSTEAAAEVWVEVFIPDRPRLVWIIVPSYQAPHKEIDYLHAWAKATGVLSGEHFPEGGSCKVEMFGGQVRIETKTAQDIEGIAGEPCDMVLVAEAGQMRETVVDAARGRVIVKRGRIVFSGTVEDAENKPQFAWYSDTAEQWLAEGANAERMAVSLPTWANRRAFPGGEQDPEIQRLRWLYRETPFTFDRRFAGIPGGHEFLVYPLLWSEGEGYDPNRPTTSRWHFDTTDRALPWAWYLGAGGHDYGDSIGHPSTLAVGTVLPHHTPAGLLVIRDAWEQLTGDPTIIENRRRLMGQRYNILPSRWAFDPMQTEAAKQMDVEAAKKGAGARERRVGYVEGRMNNDTLRFDLANPMVHRTFEQMKRVHKIKSYVKGQGMKWEYHRSGDDLAAAVEQLTELVDTKQVNPEELMGHLPSLVSI